MVAGLPDVSQSTGVTTTAMRWMSDALAARCAALEAEWLDARLARLGHAPNLALTACAAAPLADVALKLSRGNAVDGVLRFRIDQWPFADATFGTIAVQHAHEFLTDADSMFSEATRVLQPGGRLLVTGFSPYAWSRWHRLRRSFQVRPHLQSPGRMTRTLARLGFKAERAHSLPWPDSRVERHLPLQSMHAIYLLIGLKQPLQWINRGTMRLPAGVVPG